MTAFVATAVSDQLECLDCGALVLDEYRHRAWHDALRGGYL